MLKLWGRANSINVQKAIWALDEAEVPYERLDAGMQFGVVNEPAFKKLNPNALVPVLEVDGKFFWESNAIVRFVSAMYAVGTLWPSDPLARAESDLWMDWQQTTLWPALKPGFWGLVRTPEEERNPAAIEASRKACIDVLARANDHLATRPFVAGDHLTMGDIPLGVSVHRWFALPWDRVAFPHLEAWYERLKTRPSYRDKVALPLK